MTVTAGCARWSGDCYLVIAPKGYSRRQFKGLSAKWMAELLEPMVAMQLHSLVGRTGKRKSKELPPSQ